jgi:hypothetical protein
MFNKKKYSLITIAALVLTLALGLVAFVPIDTANAAAHDAEGFNHGRGPGGFRPGGPNSDEALAEALGVSVEDLQAAYETIRAAALEQAVADGKLTQEQADQIAERDFFRGRGHFGPMDGDADILLADALGISLEELQAARESVRTATIQQALEDGKINEEQVTMMEAHQALQNYMEKDEMIAKALGITVEELEAAKEDSQRLPDLMDELGIDREEFEATMQTLREEILQQAVEDGVITQEQADQMLVNEFRGKCHPGMRGFPGQPKRGGPDGTNFQLPGQQFDQG